VAIALAIVVTIASGVTLTTCASRRPSRVVVLGIDGMDPETIDLLMSEGKLPNFARMRRDGAYGRLQSMHPLLSPVIWTTIATGKTPDHHGIGHFTAVNQTTGEQLPVTAHMRKVKALWNMFSDAGRKVAVVGWWATWPAENVNGFVVSDHTCYHFLFRQGQDAAQGGGGITYPPELLDRIKPLIRRPSDVTAEEAARYIDVTPAELSRPFDFDDDVGHFKWALATADSYRKISLRLWQEERPAVLFTYIEGVDSTSHLFGHLFRAQGFSGELLAQQKKFGRAVEQMYLYADQVVGEHLKALGKDGTLLVLSDHGFQLGTLQEDPSKTRDMRRVSERFHREHGILYLYGHHVKRGRLDEAKILDVAPTVLALAGMRPARDMPGRVLVEALTVKAPGPRVASYETGPTAQAAAAQDDQVNPEIMERLRSLGYVGGSSPTPGAGRGATGGDSDGLRSPQGERNIAAMLFEQGRHQEAADAYRHLVEQDPKDSSLHTSLAGALGALGRYDEAMKELDIAVRIEPLNAEAYHNRGAVYERLDKREAAIREYRTAVRYNPSYEPSRKALMRLTGNAEVNPPRSPKQAQAARLAEEAGQAARHGNYAQAMRLLDEAEKLAPEYVIVHQYRANVAYLSGDRRGAIRALERALAIEPGNALYRANLARLKEAPGKGKP
jgi:predicted AlkP superfamily phosphohydrolase/phosphomutase/Flp pilus assembly protein TadD